MSLVAAIALTGLFGWGVASAQDITDVCDGSTSAEDTETSATGGQACTNEGDADGEVQQEGSASSGDGVAGQVVGVVSAGDTSVDATNRSDDVDVETGDATASNSAFLHTRAGLGFDAGDGAIDNVCDAETDAQGDSSTANGGILCANEGDAEGSLGQVADAASGDGVGGQVVGVVTSAGGSADLVLDNETTDSDVRTGDAEFSNAGGSPAILISEAGIFFTAGGGGT